MGADEERNCYGENPADPSRRKQTARRRGQFEKWPSFGRPIQVLKIARATESTLPARMIQPIFLCFIADSPFVFSLAVCGLYLKPSSTKYGQIR
jgi:hypothetical protein